MRGAIYAAIAIPFVLFMILAWGFGILYGAFLIDVYHYYWVIPLFFVWTSGCAFIVVIVVDALADWSLR